MVSGPAGPLGHWAEGEASDPDSRNRWRAQADPSTARPKKPARARAPGKSCRPGGVVRAVEIINEFINMQRGAQLLRVPPLAAWHLQYTFSGVSLGVGGSALGTIEDV